MGRYELSLGSAQGSPVGTRELRGVGESTTTQVGENASSTDAGVPEPEFSALPVVHPPETASTTDSASRSDESSVADPIAPSLLQESQNLHAGTRASRHARDGGVRLAGGPLDGSDDDDTASIVTLPPPYDRY